jgi:hypothetical protein
MKYDVLYFYRVNNLNEFDQEHHYQKNQPRCRLTKVNFLYNSSVMIEINLNEVSHFRGFL